MKSFLLKNNRPIIKWSLLKENTFFQGSIPKGYDLAVCPSTGFIVVDVDNKGGKCGYNHIPQHIVDELKNTFNYNTANSGSHYWLKYSGKESLANKASSIGIDLRVGPSNGNSGGYVKWHLRDDKSPLIAEENAKNSSEEMNEWLESLFGYVNK